MEKNKARKIIVLVLLCAAISVAGFFVWHRAERQTLPQAVQKTADRRTKKWVKEYSGGGWEHRGKNEDVY